MTTIAGRRQDEGTGAGSGTRPLDTTGQQGSLKRSVQAAFEGRRPTVSLLIDSALFISTKEDLKERYKCSCVEQGPHDVRRDL